MEKDNKTARRESPLMLCDEVCALLGLSVEAFRAQCRDGKLPAAKHGGRWYVRRAELYKMLGIGGE